MSFADPTSWTDVDSAGAALDWTARDHKLLYPGYEMLRKALVERCNAALYTVPATLTERAAGTIYDGWLDAYQATMTDVLRLFVDHTDSGGNWDGQNVAIPLWTEPGLLAAIGAASRISTGIPLAAWSLQQYQLLNMLRWTVVASGRTIANGAIRHSAGGSWAAADAAWPAAAWTSTAAYSPTAAKYDESGIAYHAYRVRGQYHYAPPGGVYDVTRDVDVYLLGSTPGYWGVAPAWDQQGSAWVPAVDVQGLYETLTANTGTTITSSMVGDINDVPPNEPAGENDVIGWRCRSTEARFVIKWNVPGGFLFQ